MRILILGPLSEAVGLAEATLLSQGHRVTHCVGGAVWPKLADDFVRDHDGFVMIDPHEHFWKLAAMLRERDMPIWLDWQAIPPATMEDATSKDRA